LSAEKRWRLICYDVREPKRYRELYKVMKGVGRRIQYSVFRSRLDDREVEHLRWKLAKILDPADRLLVVDLCPTCASRAISRNHVDGWTEKAERFTIVASQASAHEDVPLGTEAENGGEFNGIAAKGEVGGS
jgi:CRISPR-associated protein Cas2